MSSPDAAKPILDAISPNALVLLNTQHKITGILPLSDSDLPTLRFPGDPAVVRIMKALDGTNSTKVIIKTGNSTREMNAALNLTRCSLTGVTKLKRNGSNGPQGSKGNRYNDAGRAPTFYSFVER